ncbi:hypothetical protein J8F10_24560 [Gemmata sp. G18]|uniref:Uncharacterized protein n=1 Tax=Gemmata palustris TaxID=2822762 RepID=A0ABS5BXP8_9BACT|nr:hypothetical protein [Gemmata palustris]MBP3958433.1 hypothetical protein [Gemmata palustris]
MLSSTSAATKDLVKEVEDVTRALREQADTFGPTAEQATLYKRKGYARRHSPGRRSRWGASSS